MPLQMGKLAFSSLDIQRWVRLSSVFSPILKGLISHDA
jgi:hypothetical protein